MKTLLFAIFPFILAAQLPPADSLETERKEIFTEPGITGKRDDKWVGSDHLFNLTRDIGVTVDIIMPQGKFLSITKEDLEKEVGEVFRQGGLSPHFTFSTTGSPLPFFNIFLLIYPVPNGYVASVDGRLFEEVELPRVVLNQGIYWQAITWEKQTLIIAAEGQFLQQLRKTVSDISKSFVDRFQHFQSLK